MKNPGIYILTSPSGKSYVGLDANLPKRSREHLSGKSPQCPTIHHAIKKYGRDAFDVQTIAYPGISRDALCAVEVWYIAKHDAYNTGYNETKGGEGVDTETVSRLQRERVADGTHHFLDSEFHRQNALRRVQDGTHPFLNGERSQQIQRERVKNGTHNFLRGEHVRKANRERVKNGTHNFLGGDLSRRVSRERVANGTHNFLDSEFHRRNQLKRVQDGTHNFVGDTNPAKRLSEKGRWMWVRSLAMCWYEMHDYVMKRRAEFYSQVIPDMSNAEQLELF